MKMNVPVSVQRSLVFGEQMMSLFGARNVSSQSLLMYETWQLSQRSRRQIALTSPPPATLTSAAWPSRVERSWTRNLFLHRKWSFSMVPSWPRSTTSSIRMPLRWSLTPSSWRRSEVSLLIALCRPASSLWRKLERLEKIGKRRPDGFFLVIKTQMLCSWSDTHRHPHPLPSCYVSRCWLLWSSRCSSWMWVQHLVNPTITKESKVLSMHQCHRQAFLAMRSGPSFECSRQSMAWWMLQQFGGRQFVACFWSWDTLRASLTLACTTWSRSPVSATLKIAMALLAWCFWMWMISAKVGMSDMPTSWQNFAQNWSLASGRRSTMDQPTTLAEPWSSWATMKSRWACSATSRRSSGQWP